MSTTMSTEDVKQLKEAAEQIERVSLNHYWPKIIRDIAEKLEKSLENEVVESK